VVRLRRGEGQPVFSVLFAAAIYLYTSIYTIPCGVCMSNLYGVFVYDDDDDGDDDNNNNNNNNIRTAGPHTRSVQTIV